MSFEGRMSRDIGLASLFGGIVLALLASSGTSHSASTLQPKPPEGQKLEWVGASVCQRCHQEKEPRELKEYQQTQAYDFVRLWENRVWENHDLHSLAYKHLTTNATKEATGGEVNKTAQRMEDNLKAQRGKEYTVALDVNCLVCHASSQSPLDRETFAASKPDFYKTEDGVGCEMCHGHGSRYRDEHQKSNPIKGKAAAGEASREVPWRNWAPNVKADWGLVNLRDPIVAATKCASCHVGNKDEGRFVTHEMFAVGHPPLPPLDLMAYAREQPRHWGLASDMPYITSFAKKDPKKAFDTFHYREGESLVTRRFVESTIGALAASNVLTGQLAGVAKEKNDGLDYAAFDCYSCHHNLKYPSDRQARGYDGPPGRPQFRLAPFALARLVIDHAAAMEKGADLKPLAAELDAIHKRLALSFGNKTYGDPDAITKATEEVAAWCSKAKAKLQPVLYTRAETAKLLAKVVEAASREPSAEPRSMPASQRAVADPELAQLYVWAAETLILDLAGTPEEPKGGPPAKPPAVVAELREALKGSVVTRLRGPEALFHYEQKATGGLPSPTLVSVDKRLTDRMETFNSYRGDAFREAFKKLAPKIGELK